MEEKKGISRRGFLKTAAAAGAALTILPVIDKAKAADITLFKTAVAAIPVVGDRYNAEQQKQVGR